MAPETQTSRTESPFTTVAVGARSQVIALRGTVRGSAVDELRETLVAAIESGVREIVLDLTDVESLGSPVHDLLSAASITLADRGGVLLVWSRKYAVDEPTYVMSDVRDRALAELVPATGSAGRRRRGRP
jgi:anti-anti-sigma regulatory factor